MIVMIIKKIIAAAQTLNSEINGHQTTQVCSSLWFTTGRQSVTIVQLVFPSWIWESCMAYQTLGPESILYLKTVK